MEILLVNDDGYNSEGILLLKELLSKYGHVTIVAPKEHQSGKSAALTFLTPLSFEKISEDVYAVDGYPVDCTSIAFNCLDNKKFDLVVSGCNYGLNISYDIVYSGTLGACFDALTYRVPCLAFSADLDFKCVRKNFDKVMEYILKNNLINKEHIVNVNFPKEEDIEGIRMTKLFYRKHLSEFKHIKDNTYQAYRVLNDREASSVGTDAYSVTHKEVSITILNKLPGECIDEKD